MYKELTDPKDIGRAHAVLWQRLRSEFPHKVRRVVGYPSGYFHADVRFALKSGSEVGWWYGNISEDKQTYLNFFGHGDPGAGNDLRIDLQFSIPRHTFNRSHGGLFVRDIKTDQIALAHRGIVTRHKSRVRRELLLQQLPFKLTTINSAVPPKELGVLLVAPIDEAHIGKHINQFAREVRDAAARATTSAEDPSTPKSKKALRRNQFDVALKAYYDEFIGKARYRKSGQVVMDCRHGAIVKALRDHLAGYGKHYKSGAIDLAVETSSEIMLFEVKPSASTQSIYTGIGQLYVHGAMLARKFKTKTLIRHLVIPVAPNASDRASLCSELGIKIVSFDYSPNKTTFHGA